ncbi:MAG: DUF1573 domain-containing protein [Gemmataceae bacterium]
MSQPAASSQQPAASSQQPAAGGWSGRWIWAMFAIAFGLTSVSLAVYQANQAPPPTSLIVEPAVIDFGEVEKQQSLDASFTVENPFDVAANVGPIYPSCDCSVVEPKSFTLEPGQKQVVKIVWRTGRNAGVVGSLIPVDYTLKTKDRYGCIVEIRGVVK